MVVSFHRLHMQAPSACLLTPSGSPSIGLSQCITRTGSRQKPLLLFQDEGGLYDAIRELTWARLGGVMLSLCPCMCSDLASFQLKEANRRRTMVPGIDNS
jgi:hypothetical protein